MEFEYVTPLHNREKAENRRGGEAGFLEGGLLWEPVDVKEMGEQYDLGVRGRQIGEILRKGKNYQTLLVV